MSSIGIGHAGSSIWSMDTQGELKRCIFHVSHMINTLPDMVDNLSLAVKISLLFITPKSCGIIQLCEGTYCWQCSLWIPCGDLKCDELESKLCFFFTHFMVIVYLRNRHYVLQEQALCLHHSQCIHIT